MKYDRRINYINVGSISRSSDIRIFNHKNNFALLGVIPFWFGFVSLLPLLFALGIGITLIVLILLSLRNSKLNKQE